MNSLLGKKSAVPYLSPATATPSVKSETLSIQSSNHSSRSNTLERNRKETKSSVNAVIPSNLATLPTIPQVFFFFEKNLIGGKTLFNVAFEFLCPYTIIASQKLRKLVTKSLK